jgi:hypothetical protein
MNIYSGFWQHNLGLMITLDSGYLEDKSIFPGATHLAEHLMFFGPENISFSEFDQKRYELFGSIEAVTSPTKMRIMCRFPQDKLEEVIEFLSEMMFQAHLSMDDLHIIQDEINDELEEYQESVRYKDKTRSSLYLKGMEDPLGKELISSLDLEKCHASQKNLQERFSKHHKRGYFIGDWSESMMNLVTKELKLQPQKELSDTSHIDLIVQEKDIWIMKISGQMSIKDELYLSALIELMADQGGRTSSIPTPNGEYWIGLKDSEIDYERMNQLQKNKEFWKYAGDLYTEDLASDIDVIEYKKTLRRMELYEQIPELSKMTLDETMIKFEDEIEKVAEEDWLQW